MAGALWAVHMLWQCGGVAVWRCAVRCALCGAPTDASISASARQLQPRRPMARLLASVIAHTTRSQSRIASATP